MMIFWNKLAYMAQLLIACTVFMYPLRKKSYYELRTAVSTVFLLIVAYGVNTFIGDPSQERFGTIGILIYWGCFLLLCVVYVWFCVDISLSEIVYCVCCASAMQHTAYDAYQIYFLLVGEYPVVYVLIYAVFYFAYYYFFVRKLASEGRYRAVLLSYFVGAGSSTGEIASAKGTGWNQLCLVPAEGTVPCNSGNNRDYQPEMS